MLLALKFQLRGDKMIDNIEIGKRIRDKRDLMHLTREQLAEKCDITFGFLQEIESGRKGFSTETLIAFSKELSLSCDYILTGNKSDNDLSLIIDMANRCNKGCLKHLENIISSFIEVSK